MATRHAVNPKMHWTCNGEWPGYQYLDFNLDPHSLVRDMDAVYVATSEDIQLYLPTPLDDDASIATPLRPSPRVLRILYVADPVQGEQNKRRASSDIGFMTTTIYTREWELVKDLTSHVHRLSPENNGNARSVRVLIQEWVCKANMLYLYIAEIISQVLLALRLQYDVESEGSNQRFQVEFMKWEDYWRIIFSGSSSEDWHRLCQYDCIFGGINLDMGYL